VCILHDELKLKPLEFSKRIVAEIELESNVQADSLVDKQVLLLLIVNKLA